MQRYASYPDYKPSKVDWLGEIPAHWSVKRLKNVATYNDEALDERTDPDYEIEYVDISSVSLLKGIEYSEKISFEKAPSRARRKVKDGDVIISTVRTYLKAIAAINNPADNTIVSTGFAVIRPMSNLHSGYAGYLLQSNGFVGDVVAHSNGVSYPAINASDLIRIPAVEPPFVEQQTIARFLDHKTAQIDTLIAKKQALLEKLAEKRSALISHAVTKGLDLSVPMKDSGVVWLGDIPIDWQLCQFRRLMIGGTQNGLYKPKEFFSKDGTPFIQMGEAFSEPIICKAAKDRVLLSNTELSQWALNKGDLIFARRSLVFEGSGKCSVIGELPEPHVYESSMIRVRLKTKKIDPMFAFYFFGSVFGRSQILATTKRVTISGIDSQQLKDVLVCVPSLEEQKRILEYIQDTVAQHTNAVERIAKVVARLQEYRSALITNAVTGKIDVRGFKLPEADKETVHA